MHLDGSRRFQRDVQYDIREEKWDRKTRGGNRGEPRWKYTFTYVSAARTFSVTRHERAIIETYPVPAHVGLRG